MFEDDGFDTYESLMFGITNNNYKNAIKCGHDIVNEYYTVDSCDTVDKGFETAIWHENGDMVIVERYKTKELCSEGHNKWVEFCKTNPTEVYSVQTGETEKLI